MKNYLVYMAWVTGAGLAYACTIVLIMGNRPAWQYLLVGALTAIGITCLANAWFVLQTK